MAVMADCVGFQAQIASIIEMLANSAVVEICRLVEDGYAALRAQMDREREKSEAENEALRRELRDAEGRMRSYERRSRRRSSTPGSSRRAEVWNPRGGWTTWAEERCLSTRPCHLQVVLKSHYLKESYYPTRCERD